MVLFFWNPIKTVLYVVLVKRLDNLCKNIILPWVEILFLNSCKYSEFKIESGIIKAIIPLSQ